MTCTICKLGETAPGHTTVTLERSGTTLIFRDVPADVCRNCGEAYVADDVARRLLAQADAAHRAGVTVQLRTFCAA